MAIHPNSPLHHVTHGFGPVWDADSRVLVLGSMPSPKSREASFYYMHPQNRFWPVMAALFGEPTPAAEPEARREFALEHRFALWDVIKECDIVGASDSSIRNAVPNDLAPIIRASRIAHVFTTGGKAAQLYRRLCAPHLASAGIDVPMTPLPSTSPANARMRLPDLTAAYQVVVEAITRTGRA
ncbi:DNA-deoxyinosine glycosylase [Bifidobacterium callimiconis]|uniref:DNA-deoxyinosine glycosylase n=1 Tax=Bifidobacterium callimiconis TaxID=2306973 RepID=UPI001BDD36FF|nr:DNA-deoxyinosine glycosylase [Bifidobacterium callimiconis]MBT1177584.1 DNA-deoxyinosine glycosylase [Bifidobacterium callimiconis]